MWSFRTIARIGGTVMLVALVAGCGFRPLHAPQAVGAPEAAAGGEAAAEPAVSEALAATVVTPIADRAGQLLRNELVFLFSAWGEPVATRYSLGVALTETVSTIAVRITGLATRANLRLNAAYTVTDLASGQIVLRGQADAFGSYDLVTDEFATLIAARYTREQAVERLAQVLHMRLAAFYSTRDVAAGGAGG